MLFLFHKYINSLWYFNLFLERNHVPIFVDFRKLSAEELSFINIDDGYCTEDGRLADCAYQAWQLGIIKHDPEYGLTIKRKIEIEQLEISHDQKVNISSTPYVSNIIDNYRFIKRHFGNINLLRILLIRIFSLHNPISELVGFIKAVNVRKIMISEAKRQLPIIQEFQRFDSSLLKRNPKVSVIIPTLNRYTYLKDVMLDLEKQLYKNIEIIVCDQSDPLDDNFYKGWNFELRLIKQKEQALCFARNRCMKASYGELILLYDDDSRVDEDWIIQHIKAIDFFNCDISSGTSMSPDGNSTPGFNGYFKWSDQVDTGNIMFKKEILETTGLLDLQFEGQRNEDSELGLRFHLNGFKNISNPLAKRIHLKASTGGLRQTSGWDSFRPKRFFEPRPIPSLLYFSRKYFGNHRTRLMLLLTIPSSLVPYKYKGNKALRYLSLGSLIITWPIILLQVFVAWNKAGVKLKAGPKIEYLNQ